MENFSDNTVNNRDNNNTVIEALRAVGHPKRTAIKNGSRRKIGLLKRLWN